VSTDASREDLRACGTLLNTLHAEFQGALSFASTLTKLGHPDAPGDSIEELQERIQSIARWAGQLWERAPLLLADGGSDDPKGLETALGLLDELATRLEGVGRGIGTALDAVRGHAHDGEELPEAALVLAALAWASYAHEIELRGAIYHGLTLDDPELADRAGEQLAIAQDGLRVLHHLLGRFEDQGPPGCDLLGELHGAAAHLPGLYRAKTEAVEGLAAEIRELRS